MTDAKKPRVIAIEEHYWAIDWMKTVSLCKEDMAKILSGNAERILRL